MRLSAKAFLVDDGGRLLLLDCTDPARPGVRWWELPGGGVEPGEDEVDALVREVREETGFTVEPVDVGPLVWTQESTFQDDPMLVYGTEGTLSLPDANAFGGDVRVRHTRDEWEALPYTANPAHETRGIGIHDLVEAVRADRPHRASGDLALHVLETIHAVLRSAEEGRTIDIASREAAAA